MFLNSELNFHLRQFFNLIILILFLTFSSKLHGEGTPQLSPTINDLALSNPGGCTLPVPAGAAVGNYLLLDDLSGGLIYFESPDNLNLCVPGAFGQSISFRWANGTYDGTTEGVNPTIPVVLVGSGITISTTVNVTGLQNTGWQDFTIPLTDANWSGASWDDAAGPSILETTAEAGGSVHVAEGTYNISNTFDFGGTNVELIGEKLQKTFKYKTLFKHENFDAFY